MRNRTTLTKSLHTVTVVSNVAALIALTRKASGDHDLPALALVQEALRHVGQSGDWSETDPTVEACTRAVRKLGLAQ